MSDHKIRTDEEIDEVKTFYMVHCGHKSGKKYASIKVYTEEEYDKVKEDLMKLALDNPNRRYYYLKTEGSIINRVENAVIKVDQIKK